MESETESIEPAPAPKPVKTDAKRSIKWLLAMSVLQLGLIFFISFAYVNSLWSQKYLEEVSVHWEHSPITDV